MEVTIQDIITERNYWRQFKTRRNFDRIFAILFEEEKTMRGGGVYKIFLSLILDRYYLNSKAEGILIENSQYYLKKKKR